MENEIRPLVLALSFEEHGEFAHIVASAREIRADGEVYGIGTSSWEPNHDLAGLQVRCQLDNRASESYAWTVEYRDVFSVNLERAQGMAKVLGKVARSMERFEPRDGSADTFGVFLVRAAQALKVTSFGGYVGRPGGWHDRGEWRTLDLPAAKAWVTERETSYLAKRGTGAA